MTAIGLDNSSLELYCIASFSSFLALISCACLAVSVQLPIKPTLLANDVISCTKPVQLYSKICFVLSFE